MYFIRLILGKLWFNIDHSVGGKIIFRFDGLIKPFQKTLRTSVKRIIQLLLHNTGFKA